MRCQQKPVADGRIASGALACRRTDDTWVSYGRGSHPCLSVMLMSAGLAAELADAGSQLAPKLLTSAHHSVRAAPSSAAGQQSPFHGARLEQIAPVDCGSSDSVRFARVANHARTALVQRPTALQNHVRSSTRSTRFTAQSRVIGVGNAARLHRNFNTTAGSERRVMRCAAHRSCGHSRRQCPASSD